MKFKVVLSALFFFFVLLSPVIAQDSEPVCYWRSPDGSTMDLSRLCKTSPSPSVAPNADFQSLAKRYPSGISQSLNNYFNQNSDSAIASAITVCRVLKYGGASAESTRQQALAADNSSSLQEAKQQIIRALAVTRYCPQFSRG